MKMLRRGYHLPLWNHLPRPLGLLEHQLHRGPYGHLIHGCPWQMGQHLYRRVIFQRYHRNVEGLVVKERGTGLSYITA